MFYADTVGPSAVYDDVCAFQKQHGELWQPAPLLERLAREGKRFRER
jgi:3-hydroxyacyl-CoA dehydrogenase